MFILGCKKRSAYKLPRDSHYYQLPTFLPDILPDDILKETPILYTLSYILLLLTPKTFEDVAVTGRRHVWDLVGLTSFCFFDCFHGSITPKAKSTQPNPKPTVSVSPCRQITFAAQEAVEDAEVAEIGAVGEVGAEEEEGTAAAGEEEGGEGAAAARRRGGLGGARNGSMSSHQIPIKSIDQI